MSEENNTPLRRRDVLKATSGLAGGAVLSTGQSVAALGSDESSDNSYQQCFDECRPITREERRLFITVEDEDENEDENEDEETPVAQQILERSGFDQLVTAFMQDLCGTESEDEVKQVVEEHGIKLWETAVDCAQGEQSDLGDSDNPLHPYDSRPLYWARLKMAALIRQWDPSFRVSDEAEGDLHGSPQQLDPNHG